MRLVDFLQPVFMIAAVALLVTRRRVVRRFEKAEAYDEASTLAFPRPLPLQRWWLSRLKTEGVLKVTSDALYWMDRTAWQHHRAVRRRRGLTIVACIVTVVAIVFILLWSQGG